MTIAPSILIFRSSSQWPCDETGKRPTRQAADRQLTMLPIPMAATCKIYKYGKWKINCTANRQIGYMPVLMSTNSMTVVPFPRKTGFSAKEEKRKKTKIKIRAAPGYMYDSDEPAGVRHGRRLEPAPRGGPARRAAQGRAGLPDPPSGPRRRRSCLASLFSGVGTGVVQPCRRPPLPPAGAAGRSPACLRLRRRSPPWPAPSTGRSCRPKPPAGCGRDPDRR